MPSVEASKPNDKRVSSRAAGYMELDGAVKDGDCRIVKVAGGISKDKGCCNLFDPKKNVTLFSCGTCTFEK